MQVSIDSEISSLEHEKSKHTCIFTILFCIDEEECDQRKKNASKKQRPKDSSSTETSTSTSLPTAPTFGK
jgi:hypothetical protein